MKTIIIIKKTILNLWIKIFYLHRIYSTIKRKGKKIMKGSINNLKMKIKILCTNQINQVIDLQQIFRLKLANLMMTNMEIKIPLPHQNLI